MGRMFFMSVAMLCVGGAAWAQSDNETSAATNKTTIGSEYPLLSAGAEAIRAGSYDRGIDLTVRGLESPSVSNRARAAALSNLCAAHAAKHEPDQAIDYCTQSLDIASSWRAYSNRSYAYWLKGDYSQAALDVDSAAVIAPRARQVVQIRGMINEASLEPSVVIEEHQ